MGLNKPFLLIAAVAMLSLLLIAGCTGNDSSMGAAPLTGPKSPWAPGTASQGGTGTTGGQIPPNSSFEAQNQPVPFNFSLLEGLAGENQSNANESANASGAFFISLAMNSSRNVSLTEFSRHSTASSCWTEIHGLVFDMTGLVNSYPLGASKILNTCALDSTGFYDSELARVLDNSSAVLENAFVGIYTG